MNGDASQESGTQDSDGSDVGARAPTHYYGKYRGVVVNNVDPKQLGRVQAMVPDVLGMTPSTWALPCLPFGGTLMGFFTVPLVGSKVWIEFEQGDPDYPIWTGCWWGTVAELPPMARLVPPAVPGVTLQTSGLNGIQVSDVPGPTGGIVLKTAGGATLIVNDTGIYIQNGKGASVTMVGPTITVNNGALVVTGP